MAVLRAGLALGIKPGRATLRAMLSCCTDLDFRSNIGVPVGLATGLGFQIQGLGIVDLQQVLAACEEAVEQQECQQQQGQHGETLDRQGSQQPQQYVDLDVTADSSSSSNSSLRSREAQQAAADLLRQWAFNSTFAYIDGVLSHGPTWAVRPETQLQPAQVLDIGGSSNSGSNAVAAVAGL